MLLIYNGNRAEWSPIRSVIIRVNNEIRRLHSGSLICLIMSMISDQIGRHEVLLPINHNYNKICYILDFFLIKTQEILRVFIASSEKRPFKHACAMARTVPLHRPISAKIRTVDSQSDFENFVIVMIKDEQK